MNKLLELYKTLQKTHTKFAKQVQLNFSLFRTFWIFLALVMPYFYGLTRLFCGRSAGSWKQTIDR